MTKIMQWAMAATLIFCGAMMLTSCSNDDNPADQQDEYAGLPLIIFDTDICSSADDLFALETLYRYEDEGRCCLLGVMVDREGERNAAFADVMNTYFGHGDVPIGLVRGGMILIDGGVINPTPLNRVKRHSGDIRVGIDVSGHD